MEFYRDVFVEFLGTMLVHLLRGRGGGTNRLRVLGRRREAGDRIRVWADVSLTLMITQTLTTDSGRLSFLNRQLHRVKRLRDGYGEVEGLGRCGG